MFFGRATVDRKMSLGGGRNRFQSHITGSAFCYFYIRTVSTPQILLAFPDTSNLSSEHYPALRQS